MVNDDGSFAVRMLAREEDKLKLTFTSYVSGDKKKVKLKVPYKQRMPQFQKQPRRMPTPSSKPRATPTPRIIIRYKVKSGAREGDRLRQLKRSGILPPD
jgi:hypothetical protein